MYGVVAIAAAPNTSKIYAPANSWQKVAQTELSKTMTLISYIIGGYF
jgi:hypothetical protein